MFSLCRRSYFSSVSFSSSSFQPLSLSPFLTLPSVASSSSVTKISSCSSWFRTNRLKWLRLQLEVCESQVDRVYLSSSDVVAVFDHGRKRTFQIRKQGLPDVAVWNPWEKKAKALTDLGDEEYKQMLCVDGASLEKPITLKPREVWTGQLELSVLSSC